MDPLKTDEDSAKGAVEQDRPEQETNTSLAGQIGHRHKNDIVDTNDTDLPEPGQSPEHSGELMHNIDREKKQNEQQGLEPDDDIQEEVNQDPGHRQKQNQGEREDDPLAA
ncbi:MAG TPA: hypothetical protein VD837_16445 [Terriglobales bacterium]|nr:hypothetical protein [Terriglobales bacterium]